MLAALVVDDHQVDDGHLISGCLPELDGLRSEREVVASAGTQVAGSMPLQNLERDDTVSVLEIHHHDLGRTAEVLGIH